MAWQVSFSVFGAGGDIPKKNVTYPLCVDWLPYEKVQDACYLT